MRYVPLVCFALLLAPGAARPAWGPAGCGRSAAPVFASPFVVPFAPTAPVAPRVIDQRPVTDARALDAAVERVLARREAKALAKACAKARSEVECVGLCRCNRCEGRCPCREGAGRCGDGCACVLSSPVPASAPAIAPAPALAHEPGPARIEALPTGVDWSRIGGGYSHRGKPCSRAEAVAAIEGTLADDSARPYFTVVFPEDVRKRILADLDSSPLLSPLKALVRVQAYDPTHWAVARAKLSTGLWLQKADGTKMGVLPTYEGPDALAKLLRRADPNAPPEPAPGPSPGPAPGPSPCRRVPWSAILSGCCLAILLYLAFFKREK